MQEKNKIPTSKALLKKSPTPKVLLYLLLLKGSSPSKPLESLVLELLPGREPDHIIRSAKKGDSLTPDVAHCIATAAQLRVFSDELFGWEMEFSLAREVVLHASADRLNVRLKQFNERLCSERNLANRVKLLYIRMLTEFRIAQEAAKEAAKKAAKKATEEDPEKDPGKEERKLLRKAQATAVELEHEAERAGSAVSPLFRRVARVNQASIGWRLVAVGEPTDQESYVELLRKGQAACQDAADHHQTWTGARCDQAEYSALLHLAGEPNQLQKLDLTILMIAKSFPNSPVNYVVHLLRTCVDDPSAKDVIEGRPIFQRMVELSEVKYAIRLDKEVIIELDKLRMG